MLLGRDLEAARLAALLDGARAGRSAALIVHGEPGIGKTSLLEQTAGRASEFAMLRVRPLEAESEIPFAGLSDLLGPILGLLGDIPGPQGAALSGALALGPPVPGDRFAVAAATLSLLSAASERSPVLVVIDDAHWLDQPSREALLFAARRLESEGVLLLLGMRERDWLYAAGVDELELHGLSPDDAAALVDSIGVVVSSSVREQLARECSGNPLAILEATSTLTAAELCGSAPINRPLAVGAALERAFAQNLVRLPAQTRQALLIAAASGTGATREIVRALTAAGLDMADLGPAERGRVIALVEDRVEFRHPLVRSAAYHLQDPVQRRAAHRALAEALGDEPGGRAAWHWAAATAGPDEGVAAMLENAGMSALARSAYSLAASAFEAAAALSLGDDERLRRTMGAGRALWLAGEGRRSASLLKDVVDLAADPIARADLQQLRAAGMLFAQPVAETYGLLAAEAELVGPHDASRAATMLAQSALVSCISADVERAVETARHAVEMGRRDGGSAEVFATFALGHTLAMHGELDDALRLIEPLGIPEMFETPGEFTLAAAGLCQGFVWMERWEAARTTLERIISAARAAGAPTILVLPLAVLSELELRQGRLTAAYAAAAESVQLAAETGQVVEAAYSLAMLARVEAVLGRDQDCRTHVDAALGASRRTGAHSIELYSASVLGLLELSLGHVEQAIVHLADCSRFDPEHGIELPTVIPWAADLVEAYVRTGAVSDARHALDALERRATVTNVRWGHAAAARCRGLLAADDDYEREFAIALDWHDDESTFERARTQLCLGMRRRRSRHRSQARAVLREALAYFESVGAEPWAEQARAELRATGETPSPAANGSLSELTPQELQVALTVAKGATNKEVAASLFLSPKTVEFHLGNTYRKLGIRSRTELVRLAAGLA